MTEQTTKEIYQHAETGCIYAIERTWEGQLVASAGPLDEPLDEPDSYVFTTELIDWIRTQNDKMILI